MKKVLPYVYFEISENNIEWCILLLLHEFRIMQTNQILQLFSFDKKFDRATIFRHLKSLKSLELIDFIYEGSKKTKRCYYLTKKGHNSIGGKYTFPKVPEYNLKHHLEVTNYLIKSLEKVNDLEYFLMVISERRQVYEKKDMTTNKQGNSYHVADYILQFQRGYIKHDWYVEIELTLKSRRRYVNGIFPKYLNLLMRDPMTRLIYVSPNPIIKEELDTFKSYFEIEKSRGKYQQIKEDVFDRLHIFSSEEFSDELDRLLETEFNKERRNLTC